MTTTTGSARPGGAADDEPGGGGRMPLLDHVRELRSRLIRAALAVVAGSILAWTFYEQIIDVLIEPVCTAGVDGVTEGRCESLVVTGVVGPLSLQLKVALFSGLVLACPVWLYQLWAFLAPGLHRHEKRWAYSFVAVGAPLFALGATLAYLLLPVAVPVLLGFAPGDVANFNPLDEYLDFVLRLIVVFGISFELPLVLIVANLAGLLSGRRIASWWRAMVFGIFVFAAAATPTGDPYTMSALALPMVVLYAVAVAVTLLVDRRRGRQQRLSAPGGDPGDAA